MKIQKQIRQVIEALRPYKPERIYLFGSWAHGEGDELSDLDLVLIKRTRARFLSRLQQVARLLPASLGGIDILVYTPQEFERMRREGNAFVEMILEEGKLIYGG
jgi:predicted nucleotidyltransferase